MRHVQGKQNHGFERPVPVPKSISCELGENEVPTKTDPLESGNVSELSAMMNAVNDARSRASALPIC